jgi:hypothetical protein
MTHSARWRPVAGLSGVIAHNCWLACQAQSPPSPGHRRSPASGRSIRRALGCSMPCRSSPHNLGIL